MIQLDKYPHSPRMVATFSENHKKHTITLCTKGQGKSAVFMARLNKQELKALCEYIEINFPIHKEDY